MSVSSGSVQTFYDQLALQYALIFEDWEISVERQAQILEPLIQKRLLAKGRILDCACGIGTQILGLALRGYDCSGSDLSQEAIQVAQNEAQKRGLNLPFYQADFRQLDAQVPGLFEMLLAFDNALPHLLDLADMQQALEQIHAKLKPGGCFLGSIRDYDQILTERPQQTPPRLLGKSGQRRLYFQLWEWAQEKPLYGLNHFIVREEHGVWNTQHYFTYYRAWQREELNRLFKQVGFQAVKWLFPAETGYYQPILWAQKPKTA